MDMLNAMQLFSRVVVLNSFAAAAEEINSCHSTVNKKISNLEAKLGVKLLYRTTRRIWATEAGRDFYIHCKSITQSVNAAKESVGKPGTAACDALHLSAPTPLARKHLCRAIAKICRHLPQLTIEVHADDTYSNLEEQGYDLAIRIGESKNSNLISQSLFTTKLLLCAAPKYLKTHGSPNNISELEQHNCLTHRQGRGHNLWEFYTGKENQLHNLQVSGSLKTNNCDMLCEAARIGEGIIYAPAFIVETDIKNGALVSLLPENTGVPVGVYVLYPAKGLRPEKVRTFINTLKEELKILGCAPHMDNQNRPGHTHIKTLNIVRSELAEAGQ